MQGFHFRTWVHIGALWLALALTACGGGGNGTTPEAVGTVAGVVLASSDSQPVPQARVSVAGLSVLTGPDGGFSLADVPVAARALLKVEAAGYAPGFTAVAVTQGQTARAGLRLVALAPATSFDAAVGATVGAPGSTAQVVLGGGSLVNAATGAAAAGTVSVSVTPINPALDPQTMPGDYSVSETVRIESFGAIKVTLQDASGAALNLKPGSLATVRIPLATRAATVPSSIPLYYFNETTGRWVREGSATLAGTAPNQYYEGSVSHFTYWNADQEQDTIYVNGCVVDAAGKPVYPAQAHSEGVDYSGSAADDVDLNGQFRVAIRKGGVATVWAEADGLSSNAVVVGPSQVDITLPTCLVMASSPPVIVQQPSDLSVDVGWPASFSVKAVGSPTLRYQWQHEGVDIPGATSPWLWLPQPAAADAGGYSVVVSNHLGSVTSRVAVLTLTQPTAPSVVNPPESLTVSVGEPAVLSVVAQGSGPLAYQWRLNGQDIAGAVLPLYLLPAASVSDAGTYTVLVSNAQGSVLSPPATLTVNAATPPVISLQPQAISVAQGEVASFMVLASGSAPLAYQWQRNGVDIVDATGPTYTTPATTMADNGAVYRVRVSNAAGALLSDGATLTVTGQVLAAPAITVQPFDANAAEGRTTTFAVLATGSPAPGYQWRRSGVDIPGATAATYTTPTLALADNGATYSVVVSNSQGTVTSREAVLSVGPDNTAQQLNLLRLMFSSVEFLGAAQAPMLLVDDAGNFLSPAAVCSAGSLSGRYNDAGLPLAGTPVPPSGTLAVTASACVDSAGDSYTGASTVSYSLTTLDPMSGTANAVVNAMRVRSGAGDRDVTANGAVALAFSGTVLGQDVTEQATVTLGAGATLRSELSGLTASYASGNLVIATTQRGTTPATRQLLRWRITQNNLVFSVAGVSYLANGYYEVGYDAPGGSFTGAGEIVLSSGGVRVGRLYATNQGVFIEVNGQVQPFRARPRAAR